MQKTLSVLLFLCAASALATNVSEYFNGYGSETRNIVGLGSAVDGWGSEWKTTHPTHETFSHPSDFLAGTQLAWDGGKHFTCTGNLTGENDGCLQGVVNNAAVIAYRFVDADPDTAGNQPMTGTVWLSAITKPIGFSQTWMNFFLGAGNNSGSAAAGLEAAWQPSKGIAPKARFANGWDTTGKTGHVYQENDIVFFLVCIEYNVDGANDRLRVWTNPELGRYEPVSDPAYSFSGADAMGSGFASLGISAAPTFLVDAIRLSDGDGDAVKGYCFVTGQPDPPPSGTTLLIQ